MKTIIKTVVLTIVCLSQGNIYCAAKSDTFTLAGLDTSWKQYQNLEEFKTNKPIVALIFNFETEKLIKEHSRLVAYKDTLQERLNVLASKKDDDLDEKQVNSLVKMTNSLLKQLNAYTNELNARITFMNTPERKSPNTWFNQELYKKHLSEYFKKELDKNPF